MTTIFVLFSQVKVGKHYNRITFKHGVRMTDIQLGRIQKSQIAKKETMGLLTEISVEGRAYDPDPRFHFKHPDGHVISYNPTFALTEAYEEYEPDSEEKSEQRIRERTQLIKEDIEGNDWAFRPENVLHTQDIDTSTWSISNDSNHSS
jgi:hypothetical protein